MLTTPATSYRHIVSVSILNLKVSFLQLAVSFSQEFFQLISVIVLAVRGRDLCIPIQHSRRTTVLASSGMAGSGDAAKHHVQISE
jgi:hypothetical protein